MEVKFSQRNFFKLLFGKTKIFARAPESSKRGKKLFHQLLSFSHLIPAGIFLLKVNNKNTRTRCEICFKLTIKTTERRQNSQENTCARVSILIKLQAFIKIETLVQVFSCAFWRRSRLFIINFEYILHLVLLFLFLTLNMQSILVDFIPVDDPP